jgi:hypothetical protein
MPSGREIPLSGPVAADLLRAPIGLRIALVRTARNRTVRQSTVQRAMDVPTQKTKLIKGFTGDWEVVIGMEVHALCKVSRGAKHRLCSFYCLNREMKLFHYL